MVTPRMSTWAVADSDIVSAEAPKPTPQRSREDLEAALVLCVEALEAMGWFDDSEWGLMCYWCGASKKSGHFDSCLRGRALAAAKGKNGNQNG